MRSGLFWIALALVGMASLFWLGLASLPVAWERPEYSHGYLIAPIALFLFLIQLHRRAPAADPATPRHGLGVAVAFLGLAVGALGNLVNIADVSTYGFILCVFGLLLVVMGTRRGLSLWAPVFYLVFMLPLPQFMYWPLSIKLQTISSEIGVALISLFGVPVYLDGNVIDLGAYQLQVAEACSGLRYLFPLASFGFLFAALYKGPFWHRAVLFLSAMPITVLMNSVRIGIIGLLVDRWGTEQAEGFLHAFEGWVIFMACIVLLYAEALLLGRLARPRLSAYTMLDLDFGGLWRQAARITSIRSSRALVLTSVAILVVGTAWHFAPTRAAIAPARSPLILFPTELGDWQGRRQLLDENTERVLAADDYLLADYASTAGDKPVNLLVAYYDSLTNGSGIHSPEVCIPSGGWEVSKWTTASIDVPSSSGAPLKVNRAIIQKGLTRQLVYYWFEQRGRDLTNDYVAKAYTVYDSVARGRTDGALVRVVTSIEQGEEPDAAAERLQRFLRLTLPQLAKYVPR